MTPEDIQQFYRVNHEAIRSAEAFADRLGSDDPVRRGIMALAALRDVQSDALLRMYHHLIQQGEASMQIGPPKDADG